MVGIGTSKMLEVKFLWVACKVFAFTLSFRGNGSSLGGGNGCYFLLAQKVTKDALGVDSGERLRAAGAHSHLPPRPPVTGDAFLGTWLKPSGGPKTRSVMPLASAH